MNETENKKSLLANHINKNTMPREELEKQILAFLDEAGSRPGTTDKPGCPLKHGLACVLCTVHNDEPRATPIDFFADGFTLWHAGEPGLKIRNIRSNQKVAIGIYHPIDHSVLNRSLQINGVATLIPYAGNEQEFMDRLKKMGVYDASMKVMREMLIAKDAPTDRLHADLVNALRRFNLIKIEPYEITYLRIHPTDGTEKNIWRETAAEA